MPELHLQRNEALLMVRLGELRTSVPLDAVLPNASTWQQIYEDVAAYGRDLFEHTFRDEQMQTMLTQMRARERLLLVSDDPLVAQIPWEYLRDQNNKLLAGRLTFARSVSGAHPLADLSSASLEIVAIPVSPIDESRVLNVEQEWRNLVEVVTTTTPPKELTLKRVRPPTCTQLGLAVGRQAPSIVHFMGHSASQDGKAFLAFEDARGRSHLVDAADFVDALGKQVLLVVLNSCLSATVAPTAFGNIAQALVRGGIPYALGMQFVLPDDAALVLSRTLYDALLQGQTIEEAVMQTRRALHEPGKLTHPDWLAGIPVLYTSLDEQLAKPLELASGKPTIQPDPHRLELTCDLTALARADHFVGRASKLSEVLEALLSPAAHGFLMLHGLGGIGKTSLARAAAERVGWYYQDRVLTVSFETFVTLDIPTNQRIVSEGFLDRFSSDLARFYELDPAGYPTLVQLQQAILQRRAHLRSLLVLDNIETLIDAQQDGLPVAQACAAFISRLEEGDGAILLTSRMVPPADWGQCQIIRVGGLPEDAGADLFQALLPQDRTHLASLDARRALSRRVQGHPLSIHLLAGRFADESATDLTTFLTNIEAELATAEQKTPVSLHDPERQKTLYACMDYSVKRLSSELRIVLDTVSIFQAAFLLEFASFVLDDSQQTALHLQNLARLGLLNVTRRTFQDGELALFDLHPVVRWYVQQHQPNLEPTVLERYGQVYGSQVREAAQPGSAYDHSPLIRFLVRQSFVDCEGALAYLAPTARGSLSCHLARLYDRLGQNRRALVLLEQALDIYQERGDVREVAVTEQAMADVLVRQGKVSEALALCEQSLRTAKELGDVREVAVTQNAMADALVRQGKVGEALALYEQSLRTYQELGDVREVAVTLANISQLLLQQGKLHYALTMAWEAYTSLNQHGFSSDAQAVQQLLLLIRGRVGVAQFDHVWQEEIEEAQPEWLRDAGTSLLDEGPVTHVSGEVMRAVRDYLHAEDWDATRRVVEERQELLFQPEVETLFEQSIAETSADEEQRLIKILELHLSLLRDCKSRGITAAFEQLKKAQAEAQPFPVELISQSIAALLGSPQETRQPHLANAFTREALGKGKASHF